MEPASRPSSTSELLGESEDSARPLRVGGAFPPEESEDSELSSEKMSDVFSFDFCASSLRRAIRAASCELRLC